MKRRTRRAAALGIAVATHFALTACAAAPPPDAWVFDPIRYDNRMDGEGGLPAFIDVAYPMAVVSDTAGGFWGVSSGSWVHIDATGTAVRRFNLEFDAPAGPGVALSPTVLIVGSGDGTPGDPSTLQLFDTEAMSWEVVYRDERLLGAVAIAGGDLYFVAYTVGEPTFRIERLGLRAGAVPVAASPVMDGFGRIALDLGPDGALYVATTSERIVVAADGAIVSREAVHSDYPAVSVNESGGVAWRAHAPANGEMAPTVSGGSSAARLILQQHLECGAEGTRAPAGEQDWLVIDGTMSSEVALLCSPSGFMWLNDRELVVSVGNEGGAPLVRVTVPESFSR